MIYIHDSRDTFPRKYKLILDANRIDNEIIDSQDPDFWEKVAQADLFIYYLGMGSAQLLRQHNLISVLDKVMGIPCFPNWKTAWHYDDKVAETFLMNALGYPLIESHIFWEKDKALAWAASAKYPQVFKLKNGASSINVIKVENRQHAGKLIKLMFGRGIYNNRVPGSRHFSIYKRDPYVMLRNMLKQCLEKFGIIYSQRSNDDLQKGYAYFQKFIPNNDFDTRVNVIGDATFAFRRMNRPKDFRSSGSGNYDYDPEKINLQAVQIAQNISREMGFQIMAYDFLIDENGSPVLNEIGCQSAGRAIPKCPGYWDWEMNWQAGHFWPQYVQLQYLLKRKDLIQPDFKDE